MFPLWVVLLTNLVLAEETSSAGLNIQTTFRVSKFKTCSFFFVQKYSKVYGLCVVGISSSGVFVNISVMSLR